MPMANAPRLRADRSPVATDEAPILLDRYMLEAQLGRGHLATVYRATDTVLERPVAVKVLHPHICRDPRFVEQFLDMERRMARLFHPNLVTIYDAGSDEEQCFVVMEYVPGGSLRGLIEASAPLPTADALRIVSQVAEALQVLHNQGIVHGEIKPDNVLLDEDGNARLVDFGIAHLATTTGVIRSDSLARTAPYLSPEQLEQGLADARSDIYALGLLTYELLAGRPPFEGETWIVQATRRLETEPYPLGQLRPALRPALVAAVMRALERDPAQRFDSADEFRAALAGVRGQAPGARGDGEPQASARSGRRTRSTADRAREQVSRASPTPLPASGDGADLVEPGAPMLPTEWERPQHTEPSLAPDPRPLAPDQVGPTDQTAVVPRPARPRGRGRPDSFTLTLLGGAALVALALLGLLLALPALAGALSGRGDQAAVKMPDLRGRPLEAARQDLGALGLQPGTVQEREVAGRQPGTIVDQSIRPSASVAAGRAVDLTVAIPPRVNAPNLVERSLGDAQAELERRGLRLGGVQTQPTADKRAGTVIGQEPRADAQLRQGDAVSVTIAVPPTR
jgi:serine/threonine-protein kinase